MKLTIENYTKKIRGKTVLNQVNAVFEPGRIVGLYGRNGSGKSMLLRAIAGLIKPTDGVIHCDDQLIGKDIDFPESMGLIIENIRLQEQFDAKTNLQILRDIRKKASDADIDWALEEVGLDPENKQKVKSYSLGMNQRLAIAQAIFEQPDLLLMDEPTNALDFDSVKQFRELLLTLRNDKRIIVIASHNKEDLLALADDYYEMVEGQLYPRSAADLH